MKRKSLFLLFFIILSVTFSFAQSELTPYINFLQKQQTPKEYIFALWKESDIIILGERDHRDTTQYNLILDILSDKRFIENIGYLYLEVGVVNATEDANALIKENFVINRLISIYYYYFFCRSSYLYLICLHCNVALVSGKCIKYYTQSPNTS